MFHVSVHLSFCSPDCPTTPGTRSHSEMTLVIGSAALSQLIAALDNGRWSAVGKPSAWSSGYWTCTDYERSSARTSNALFEPVATARCTAPYIDPTEHAELLTATMFHRCC